MRARGAMMMPAMGRESAVKVGDLSNANSPGEISSGSTLAKVRRLGVAFAPGGKSSPLFPRRVRMLVRRDWHLEADCG